MKCATKHQCIFSDSSAQCHHIGYVLSLLHYSERAFQKLQDNLPSYASCLRHDEHLLGYFTGIVDAYRKTCKPEGKAAVVEFEAELQKAFKGSENDENQDPDNEENADLTNESAADRSTRSSRHNNSVALRQSSRKAVPASSKAKAAKSETMKHGHKVQSKPKSRLVRRNLDESTDSEGEQSDSNKDNQESEESSQEQQSTEEEKESPAKVERLKKINSKTETDASSSK